MLIIDSLYLYRGKLISFFRVKMGAEILFKKLLKSIPGGL